MIIPQEGAAAAEAALESGALYLEYLVWSRRVESFDVLM
jgi:hypothetical protein